MAVIGRLLETMNNVPKGKEELVIGGYRLSVTVIGRLLETMYQKANRSLWLVDTDWVRLCLASCLKLISTIYTTGGFHWLLNWGYGWRVFGSCFAYRSFLCFFLHNVAWWLAAEGYTKRCRLSWLTNSDLVYEPKCGGGGCGVSASEYSCTQGPK